MLPYFVCYDHCNYTRWGPVYLVRCINFLQLYYQIWDLHLRSFSLMLPYFVCYDHCNYTRWGPVYLVRCINFLLVRCINFLQLYYQIWDLHLRSFSLMLPYFVCYDHCNYTRWGPVYLVRCINFLQLYYQIWDLHLRSFSLMLPYFRVL